MELDFKTVKALSSPTRVNILRQVLQKESTPTQLSDQLDKSKSTVSSHLTTLTEAGLLEKDKVEGRKRVTYRPTNKAEAIVEGRERKVKFSIASSAITSVAGVALLGYSFIRSAGMTASAGSYDVKQTAKLKSDQAGQAAGSGGDSGSMGIMSKGMDTAAENASDIVEKTPEAARSVSEGGGKLQPETAFLFAGVGLLGIAFTGLIYGLILKRLG